MPSGITFKGEAEMRRTIKAFPRSYTHEARRFLYRGGEQIMAISRDQYVPVRWGHLKNTGIVVLDPNPIHIAVTLAYGGPAVTYAIPQHEIMWYHHEVGGPKYLQWPLERYAKDLVEQLRRGLLLR